MDSMRGLEDKRYAPWNPCEAWETKDMLHGFHGGLGRQKICSMVSMEGLGDKRYAPWFPCEAWEYSEGVSKFPEGVFLTFAERWRGFFVKNKNFFISAVCGSNQSQKSLRRFNIKPACKNYLRASLFYQIQLNSYNGEKKSFNNRCGRLSRLASFRQIY
jgi:hypothetical protein